MQQKTSRRLQRSHFARGERGARDFFFVRNPGADSQLDVADIDGRAMSNAGVLHFGGVLLATEPARSACFAAAAAARRDGVLISFDPNVRTSLWESPHEMRRILRAACAASNLVKLSEDDAQSLDIGPSAVGELLNETTRAVIVTRAEHGAAFVTRQNSLREVSAPRVEPVDTTGAGDAFMAAVLWRLAFHDRRLAYDVLLDSVRYGCAAGAVATLTEGAIPSLPTLPQLESMMARLPQEA
jgi:sugar/nucleoside kinase (ribokinase family)